MIYSTPSKGALGGVFLLNMILLDYNKLIKKLTRKQKRNFKICKLETEDPSISLDIEHSVLPRKGPSKTQSLYDRAA